MYIHNKQANIFFRYKDFKEAYEHVDGLAVVAVFLEEVAGSWNPELEKVADILPLIKQRGQKMETPVPISFQGLLPATSSYYTYRGSVTTPDFRLVKFTLYTV